MIDQNSAAENETIEKRRGILQAIKVAFYSSTTLRHLDFDKLPNSFVPSIIYAFLVNVLIFLIRTALQLHYFGLGSFKINLEIGLNFLTKFAIILFGSFIATCVGGYMVEFKKAPKYFLLIVSSLTYSCISVLCLYFFPYVTYYFRLGIFFLVGFYLWSSLLQSAEYSEKRLFFIHWVCNLVVYLTLEQLTVFSDYFYSL